VAPETAGVRASARSARDVDAVHWSEHLSFNRARSGSVRHAGYLLPPVPRVETVRAAVGHIARFQDEYDRPFLVETPTSYLRPVAGDLTDGTFVAQIAEQADCGILLDLHNVWANDLNGRQPVVEFLAEIPLDRVWEVHLAGGVYLDDLYLDAHIGAVPGPLLDLARAVIPRLPRVRAILFEAVPDSVGRLGAEGLAGVLDELAALARLPEQRAVTGHHRAGAEPATAARGGPGAAEREAQLLAYTTRAAAAFPGDDPGATALRYLTDQARLSLLVAAHAPRLRRLLVEHGRERTEVLLQEFLASTPASAWPAEQNAAFASWWAERFAARN
jgi:uncharacterized protein (UPF0276 family)